MDHAVHIKRLQDHAEDQARIIRGKNHTIKALRAQNSNLWCELQSRPETPSEALIERAEKAEMESARAAEVAERWREAYDDLVFLRRAEQSRPLTPDAITDEMALRFWNAFNGLNDGLEDMTLMSIDEVRTGLSAALTEPPARPEGAEKVEAVLHQYWSGDIDGDDLADRIAEEMNR